VDEAKTKKRRDGQFLYVFFVAQKLIFLKTFHVPIQKVCCGFSGGG